MKVEDGLTLSLSCDDANRIIEPWFEEAALGIPQSRHEVRL